MACRVSPLFKGYVFLFYRVRFDSKPLQHCYLAHHPLASGHAIFRKHAYSFPIWRIGEFVSLTLPGTKYGTCCLLQPLVALCVSACVRKCRARFSRFLVFHQVCVGFLLSRLSAGPVRSIHRLLFSSFVCFSYAWTIRFLSSLGN